MSAAAQPGQLQPRSSRESLKSLGWVEGGNLAIEYRWAEGQWDSLLDQSAVLVRLNIDVLVVMSMSGFGGWAGQRATQTIPVVTAMLDPGSSGFTSLGRPRGNVTGPSYMTADVAAKRLQLLKETIPGLTRVAALMRRSGQPWIGGLQPAATSLGLTLQVVDVGDPSEWEGAFSTIARGGIGGVLVASDDLFMHERKQLCVLAEKNRLPAIYEFREYAEAGGLMSYGTNGADIQRRAATYVDRILRGAKPADLPIEQPTRFELVINLKTAKALGLTIPQSVLLRADEVIE
jgi:putative ABC transport system substrate-binding protein